MANERTNEPVPSFMGIRQQGQRIRNVDDFRRGSVDFASFAEAWDLGGLTDVDGLRERNRRFLFLEQKHERALMHDSPIPRGQYIALSRLAELPSHTVIVYFVNDDKEVVGVMFPGIPGLTKPLRCDRQTFIGLLRGWDEWASEAPGDESWVPPKQVGYLRPTTEPVARRPFARVRAVASERA